MEELCRSVNNVLNIISRLSNCVCVRACVRVCMRACVWSVLMVCFCVYVSDMRARVCACAFACANKCLLFQYLVLTLTLRNCVFSYGPIGFMS